MGYAIKILWLMIDNNFTIYNTLTRTKELFTPIHEGKVGMYVCGPTVYGDGHLGHARPAITFDVLFRYLNHLGYKVRYVRNITDVGHLEHDADDGEDKIAKKARLEQLEPMEVVQHYLTRYHKAMDALNVLPPSIEPHASGHIIEQIEYIKKSLTADMPISPTVRSTSMFPNSTRNTPTASFQAETSTSFTPTPAPSTDRTRNTIRPTSHSGKRLPPNTSCTGLRLGARDFPAGTSNARQWARNISARLSTYTEAAWISCSPTTSVR